MEGLKQSKFAGITFVAKPRSGDLCGSNGLPLTPNSIRILGRAQFLKSLRHPNLCVYLDIIRCKHERTIVVCEYVGHPLNEIASMNFESIVSVAHDILSALTYLHERGIIHRAITRENLLYINKQVKLFNYGLYYMTGNGTYVKFPIGNPKYISPEVLLSGPNKDTGEKVDIWSVGIVLAELILGTSLWYNSTLPDVIYKVISLANEKNVFRRIAEDTNCLEAYNKCDSNLIELVEKLLTVDPRLRPKAKQLLKLDLFDDNKTNDFNPNGVLFSFNQDSLRQLYHFWQLAGGDVFPELKKEGLIRTKPPILSMPNLLMLEGTCYGQEKDQTSMLDLRVVHLKFGNLLKRFAELSNDCRYPLIEVMLKDKSSHCDQDDSSSLPLVIRERDTEYQFRRLSLFNRILESYPCKKDLVFKEARHDIPPFVRAEVWACLLEIDINYKKIYVGIDKETAIATDRQIEVDIPRCHQYNELLSSSDGHNKFKRILKAWVVSHPQYVYWQGLDSLCAPFLFLNFNDEARAYICLSKFIGKYLHNFFLKDNSAVIKEYLTKFKQLIAFHDPELANHLHDIGFAPELFAIPWYLTMFSHVFPIQKILHLWDSLLRGAPSYPLYVGLAILQQLRSALLSSGFNECILLFSDLPEIDIEKCVKDSIEYLFWSPSSITYREHEHHSKSVPKNNPDLEMSSVSLNEILNEFCPRISGKEFLLLMNRPGVRSRLIVVDIREPQLYEVEHIAGSVNIPLSKVDFSSNSRDGSAFSPGPELSALYGNKGKIIIVIGDNMTSASEFSYLLVRCDFPKVCSLHGGIKVLEGASCLNQGIF